MHSGFVWDLRTVVRQRPALALTLAAFILLGIACSGARDEGAPTSASVDTPPTTRILEVSRRTVEGAPGFAVRWSGKDAEGAVAGFEYAPDEPARWTYTDRGEAVITLAGGSSADAPAVSRTLFVRAVDAAGLRDPNPIRVTLGGENTLPVTTITRGPSANGEIQIVGTSVRFDWYGEDSDGVVTGYRYQLDDEPWAEIGADCTYVRFAGLSTAQFPGDTAGLHAFQVVSVDDDGAVEQIIEAPRNRRAWESVDGIEPQVRIVSNTIGVRTGENDLTAVVFQGTRLSFTWRADASRYGGVIECYEYSFDGAPYSECDLASTAYPLDGSTFAPAIGSHRLRVRATDDFGGSGTASFPFDVIAGPGGIGIGERRVLYIDDFDLGTGTTGDYFPTDAEEDAFWNSVLAGVPKTTFDAELDQDIPALEVMGAASTIVWYVDDDSRLSNSNEPHGYRNPLWTYVRGGGNVILCGVVTTNTFVPDGFFDPITVENPGCRHEPRSTYGGPESSLDWYPAFCDTIPYHPVYDFLRARRSYHSASFAKLGGLRSESRLVPDLALDLTKRGTLPDGTPILSSGLELCEQFDLRTDADVIPLWRFVDVNGAAQRVCGYWIPGSEESGRGGVVVLGFAPYFFDTLEMREVMRTFLRRFGQPIAIEE